MVARKEKRGTSFSEGSCLRIFSGYLLDSRNVLSKEMMGTYQIQGIHVKKKVPEGTCVRMAGRLFHLMYRQIHQNLSQTGHSNLHNLSGRKLDTMCNRNNVKTLCLETRS